MPLISIILPTYNVEKYIARALKSCINQTLKDIEIIVVDDKGQDKSIDIAKEYAAKDERIQIVDNGENLKLFHARINGALNSNSEFIMFLDPDDELELDACEVAYNLLNEDVEVVFFQVMQIGNEYCKNLSNYADEIIACDEYIARFSEFRWNLCAKLFRKKIYLKTLENVIVKQGINMAEDALFTYFLTQNFTKKIAISSKTFYKYFDNADSMTNVSSRTEIKKIKKSYNEVINTIKENKCSNLMFKNYYINRLEDEKYSFLRKLSKNFNIFLYLKFKLYSIYYRQVAKRFYKKLQS